MLVDLVLDFFMTLDSSGLGPMRERERLLFVAILKTGFAIERMYDYL